jgi:hypothetical protein
MTAEQLRRRGAKASSAVSGMSQDRLADLDFDLPTILARMSRMNFRGWPKSLTTRWVVAGVPAIWINLLPGRFEYATTTSGKVQIRRTNPPA